MYRPEKRGALPAILSGGEFPTFIARGLGRSYGDPSVNGEGAVVDLTRLNRMLSFDENTGMLECEAGVSFAEILEVFAPGATFCLLPPAPNS